MMVSPSAWMRAGADAWVLFVCEDDAAGRKTTTTLVGPVIGPV